MTFTSRRLKRLLHRGERQAAQPVTAFARRTLRELLPQSVGVAALAFGASLAWAEAQPSVDSVSTERSVKSPILSAEAPPAFGGISDASPLLAVFSAVSDADLATNLTWLTESKFDLA